MSASAARAGVWSRKLAIGRKRLIRRIRKATGGPQAPFARGVALALILGGCLDVLSTDLALHTGYAVEANPLVAAVQAELGPYWALPKLAVHFALAAFVLWRPCRLTNWTMTGVAVMVFAASFNNLTIYTDILAAEAS